MNELKGCPFCGSNGEDNLYLRESQPEGYVPRWFYIECQKCGTQGPTGMTEAEAVAAWNERAVEEHGS